jgi:hypothetical protein
MSSHADTIRECAEELRDACLAVEVDGGRSFALLRAMDAAEERLQDALPAETVLALLAEIQQLRAEVEHLRGLLAKRDAAVVEE